MLSHAELRIDQYKFVRFSIEKNGYAHSYYYFIFGAKGTISITGEFPISRICILTNTKINF